MPEIRRIVNRIIKLGTSMLLLAAVAVGPTSCVSQKRGYDYKSHYKRNKGKKVKVKDLTKYHCGKERR